MIGAPLAEVVPQSDFDDGAAYVFTRNAAHGRNALCLVALIPMTMLTTSSVGRWRYPPTARRSQSVRPSTTRALRSPVPHTSSRPTDRVQWQREAYLKAPNADIEDTFGCCRGAVGRRKYSGGRRAGRGWRRDQHTGCRQRKSRKCRRRLRVHARRFRLVHDAGVSQALEHDRARRIRQRAVADLRRQRAGNRRAVRSKRADTGRRCLRLPARRSVLARAGRGSMEAWWNSARRSR